MKDTSIEPGLVNAFRWLISVQLGMVAISLAVLPIHTHGLQTFEKGAWYGPFLFFLFLALMLVYLSWPPIQRKLGKFFIPIPLVMISLGPIFIQDYMLRRVASGLESIQVNSWQLIPILFVPLVLTAWQYRMPGVLVFTAGTSLLDTALLWPMTGIPYLLPFQVVGIIFTRALAYILVGVIISQLIKAQVRQRLELAEANLRLLNYATTLEQLTISRERNHMARELHDTLAHTLSAVSVQLEAARVLWDSDSEQARRLLDQTLSATREGLTETRRALQSLRASPLEDLGLCLSIRTMAQTAAERGGFELDLQLPDQLENLSLGVAQTIYRSAQEALENVVRHAGATRVSLSLSAVDGRVVLTVKDNGQGFDPERIDDDADRFGLRGLQERAALSGGKLEVTSHPGQGTTLRFIVERAYDPRAHL